SDSSSSSDSESSSGSDSESELEKQKSTKKPNESDEDESAKTGAAEESDGSDEDMEDAPEYSSTAKRQAQAQAVDPTKAVAPQPYEPPAGYKLLDTSKSNATTLDRLLANPESKQIWHITAPSSVLISQIQSVSLASIQNQSSILSHKGTDYTLAEEKESKTTKKIFVPGKKGYNPSELPVSKSLVLQQVISIPELDS
ncbi:hypothetical protein BDV97DRAFT_268171, partial [Delphinella strobiligena]